MSRPALSPPDGFNLDAKTVQGFGKEWSAFDQVAVPDSELRPIFESYFAIFPWDCLALDAVGFDLGCGTGRWGRFVAPRVGELNCIDASPEALDAARRNLAGFSNCHFFEASVDQMLLADESQDFGYSLGVLHHVPRPIEGLAHCVRKLKPGAPLLLYLYYAFDNKPLWFRCAWRLSDVFRRLISRSPFWLKLSVTQSIALAVYWPLARLARLAERLGLEVSNVPLSAYRGRSFYCMRTDALDRFGTRLEHRFTRAQMQQMMEEVGLERISFREAPPYWCAVGFKAKATRENFECAAS